MTIKKLKARIRIAVRQKLTQSLLPLSTLVARQKLRKKAPMRILIDSSVLGHGITHETAWISTSTKKWGDLDIQTGYAARIPVHSPENDERVYREVRYLPGIAHLAKSGHVQLLSSGELRAELFRQPVGRFRGYGYYDQSVFNDVKIDLVDDKLFIDLADPKEAQQKRLEACTEPLFLALLKVLGPKSNLDAYHIFTAEKFGLSCFLHVDFPLAAKRRQNARKQPFMGLKTKILLPSELAKLIGLLPIDTALLTDVDADFPTRADMHWDTQRRNRPSKQSR